MIATGVATGTEVFNELIEQHEQVRETPETPPFSRLLYGFLPAYVLSRAWLGKSSIVWRMRALKSQRRFWLCVRTAWACAVESGPDDGGPRDRRGHCPGGHDAAEPGAAAAPRHPVLQPAGLLAAGGAESASCAPFYTNDDHFTKTDSGQIYLGNVETKGGVFAFFAGRCLGRR